MAKRNFQEKVASAETQRVKRQVNKVIFLKIESLDRQHVQTRVAEPAAALEDIYFIFILKINKLIIKYI